MGGRSYLVQWYGHAFSATSQVHNYINKHSAHPTIRQTQVASSDREGPHELRDHRWQRQCQIWQQWMGMKWVIQLCHGWLPPTGPGKSIRVGWHWHPNGINKLRSHPRPSTAPVCRKVTVRVRSGGWYTYPIVLYTSNITGRSNFRHPSKGNNQGSGDKGRGSTLRKRRNRVLLGMCGVYIGQGRLR